MLKATIIVPVYNEEKCIPIVLNDLKKLSSGFEIIVVDDGSIDNTFQILQKEGVKVIRHPERRGNGAAVKTGIKNATSDIIVVFDGDGQYRADYIPHLLDSMDGADLVVGRRIKESEETILRRTGNIFLSSFASFLTGREIPDLTSGFRACRKNSIMKILNLLPDGFSLPSTSTILFMNMGLRVKFIPIKMYRRVDGPRSKLSPFQNGIKFLIIIIKLMILFDPRKVFLYFSLFILSIGIMYSVFELAINHTLSGKWSSFLIGSIIVFFLGIFIEYRYKIHH